MILGAYSAPAVSVAFCALLIGAALNAMRAPPAFAGAVVAAAMLTAGLDATLNPYFDLQSNWLVFIPSVVLAYCVVRWSPAVLPWVAAAFAIFFVAAAVFNLTLFDQWRNDGAYCSGSLSCGGWGDHGDWWPDEKSLSVFPWIVASLAVGFSVGTRRLRPLESARFRVQLIVLTLMCAISIWVGWTYGGVNPRHVLLQAIDRGGVFVRDGRLIFAPFLCAIGYFLGLGIGAAVPSRRNGLARAAGPRRLPHAVGDFA